jgi:hypothetical protein
VCTCRCVSGRSLTSAMGNAQEERWQHEVRAMLLGDDNSERASTGAARRGVRAYVRDHRTLILAATLCAALAVTVAVIVRRRETY